MTVANNKAGSHVTDALRQGLKTKRACIIWSSQINQVMRTLGEELRAEHQIVMPMRNPYSRMISSWAYGIRQKWINKNILPPQVARREKNWRLGMNWHTYREQMNSLYYEGRLVPHFTFRVEHAQEDWEVICKMIGIPVFDLPKRNPSTHTAWQDYYEQYPNLRKQVEKTMPLDTKYMPYSFDHDQPTGPLPERWVR